MPYLTLLLTLLLLSAPAALDARPPNIIFIMIDDLGWSDLGCYGDDFVETPRIDQLCEGGLQFTDFYAAGAVCSPTRCAVQSGQNQARLGITAHIPGHWRPFETVQTPLNTMALPLETVTVAESLKEVGYTTGYVGKWHLGNAPQHQPEHQGYDYTAVIGGPHLPTKYRVQHQSGFADNLKPAPDQYRTDFEADLAIQFITDCVSNKGRAAGATAPAASQQPFFLMVSPYAVHIPLGAMSDKVAKYEAKAKKMERDLPHPVYAALIEHCDDMVGRIVDAVDALGLTDNTMIVFTSDNGGLYRRYDYNPDADDNVSSLAPFKGEKGALHEGGVRVPLIIKYPPLIDPDLFPICAEPTISYDFYPTFVELAGGTLPVNQTIDGKSLVPLLKDPEAQLARSAIHWHYPHYHHDRPASSIRERDWKLIEYLDGSGDLELYFIKDDVSEEKNLATEKQGRLADLKKKLAAWRLDVGARMPIPNPHHDPERAPEWWSLKTGEPIDSAARQPFPPTEKDL